MERLAAEDDKVAPSGEGRLNAVQREGSLLRSFKPCDTSSCPGQGARTRPACGARHGEAAEGEGRRTRTHRTVLPVDHVDRHPCVTLDECTREQMKVSGRSETSLRPHRLISCRVLVSPLSPPLQHPALSSMSEPVDLATQHAAEPSTSPKAPLALPAPSDVEGGVTQLEVNGQSFSLLGKMGPTVVNSDGVRRPLSLLSVGSPRGACRLGGAADPFLVFTDPLAHRQLERDDSLGARTHPARPRQAQRRPLGEQACGARRPGG